MQVIRPLNSGGFGEVDHVQLVDGRHGARKTYKPQDPRNDSEKMRRRFQREVSVQSQLPPDFVIPILNADLQADPPWYVMALASKSLEQQILDDRSTNTISREALSHLLDALEVIHEQDYVHRDLKPANVLYENDRWKLSDFGLVLPLTGDTTVLTSASAWGSTTYAAPEQASEFHFVDARADIYSVGCILHDWVDGSPRTPFAQQRATGTIGTVIEKCTAVDPQERYQSIAELRSELFRALAVAPVVTGSSGFFEMIRSLQTPHTWTRQNVISMLRYVQSNKGSDAESLLFHKVTPDVIVAWHRLDRHLWPRVATWYCQYTEEHGFDFNFCDAIVGVLTYIYNLGSNAIKSAATLAAATLGSSHNRWFVMRQVVHMAGHNIPDALARRIATDIQARSVYDNGELKRHFIQCVREIRLSTDVYHPVIAITLRT